MNMIILKISIRNVLRQKRRNLLLGSGIAVGVCLLVIANALSGGISDILLNKIVTHFSGHIILTVAERNTTRWAISRDQERLKAKIQQTIPGIQLMRESIEATGRALGNGKAMYVSVLGIEPDANFMSVTSAKAGNLADLSNPALENPLALYEPMAKRLNVQVGDLIQMRFESVYQQTQTARFTVVAILRANNPFFTQLTYCPINRLKPLLGYQPQETGGLEIVLKHVTNPQQIFTQANRLHDALQPDAAGYHGIVSAATLEQSAQILAVAPDAEATRQFTAQARIVAGSLADTLADKQAALISQPFAEALRVGVGDVLTTTYQPKFDVRMTPQTLRVGAIFEPNTALQADMLFVSAGQMYQTFFPVPPREPAHISQDAPLFAMVLKEWTLLERTADTTAYLQKQRALALSDWHGTVLDVATLPEYAGDVVGLQNALGLVTVVGLAILFFIIQVGVVNTLRMTIRERTREIGTVRAIGMRQADVRGTFVAEVLLLTLAASIVGLLAGFALMGLLGQITIVTGDSMMGFFLLNQHLHFVPQAGQMLISLALICGLALLTAYFPARQAARLSVVAALRHYE